MTGKSPACEIQGLQDSNPDTEMQFLPLWKAAGRGWEGIKKEGTAWSARQQCESLSPPSSYRTVLLRLLSLVFLLVSLRNQITCGGNMKAERCKACGYNYEELPVRTL